jgi:hypothetical protein
MTKPITLETLAAQLAKMDARMESGIASIEEKITSVDTRMATGFAAVADDIADIKHEMGTKDQIVALHTQVNAIEIQLRDMKHVKLHARVADLEEKVFGAARA